MNLRDWNWTRRLWRQMGSRRRSLWRSWRCRQSGPRSWRGKLRRTRDAACSGWRDTRGEERAARLCRRYPNPRIARCGHRRVRTLVPFPPQPHLEVRMGEGRAVNPTAGAMDVLREVRGGAGHLVAVANEVRDDAASLHMALHARLPLEGQLHASLAIDAEGRQDRVPAGLPGFEVRRSFPLTGVDLRPLSHEALEVRDGWILELAEATEGRVGPRHTLAFCDAGEGVLKRTRGTSRRRGARQRSGTSRRRATLEVLPIEVPEVPAVVPDLIGLIVLLAIGWQLPRRCVNAHLVVLVPEDLVEVPAGLLEGLLDHEGRRRVRAQEDSRKRVVREARWDLVARIRATRDLRARRATRGQSAGRRARHAGSKGERN